ncbi:hypothetical protein JCM10212_000346 [Sporobolomyces blumeae]
MSFFFKVLTGAVIGGSATVYYRDQIASTSQKLSRDLDALSHSLVQLQQRQSSDPIRDPLSGDKLIPNRLPLSEEIKARWNEQVLSGLESIGSTDWSSVAAAVYHQVKAKVAPKVGDEVEGVVGEVQSATGARQV